MSKRLANKVAIVTASTAGIGLSIARKLGQDGARVVVSSRRQNNVDSALNDLRKTGGEFEGLVCHVGQAADRQKLVDFALQKFGQIDIFVSNAASSTHFGSILDIDEASWDKMFDTNVKSSLLLSQAIIPHLKKNKNGGSIVFVASVAAYLPLHGIHAYSITKTALLALTRSLAETVGPDRIRVNAIAPGIIRTDFSKALLSMPEAENAIKDQLAIKRVGEPDDCGGAVSFLCSDDAAYITGETVLITGGMKARL